MRCILILEQTIQEVSNRYSFFSEIAEAVRPENVQKLTIQNGPKLISQNNNIGEGDDNSKSKEKEKTPEIIEHVGNPRQNIQKDKDNCQENQKGNDFPTAYSSFEEQFAQQYALLNSEKNALSFYLLDDNKKSLEKFYQKTEFSDTSKEILEDEEAQEAVQEALYEAATNSREMDLNTRKKFNLWQQFNKALLFLYDKHSLAQTSDVNYSINC